MSCRLHSSPICCDFRLTDFVSGRKADRDAHKLITVQTLRISALVGITGLGDLDGKPVGQWVAEVVAELGQEASVDVLLEMLRRHAEPALAKVVNPVVRRHTFVVGSIAGTQEMVSLVSNFETLRQIAGLTSSAPRRAYEDYIPRRAHHLAVAGLYVEATEAYRRGALKKMKFDTEPDTWRDYGDDRTVEPDAILKVQLERGGKVVTRTY
jgi:hypothetical protein